MVNNKSIFIFIGPPGSGKGSLTSLCVDIFGWLQLSTGNLCRKHIVEQTKLGKEVEVAIKSGGLVTDSLITMMVKQELLDIQSDDRSVILDGYPRSVGQAESFEDILKNNFADVPVYVVLFFVPDDQLVTRIENRLLCQNKDCQAVYSSVMGSSHASKQLMICEKCGGALGHRDDDTQEAIKVRLAMYHQHTQPLIQFYKSEGKQIIELRADAPLEKVFEEFRRKIFIKMV